MKIKNSIFTSIIAVKSELKTKLQILKNFFLDKKTFFCKIFREQINLIFPNRGCSLSVKYTFTLNIYFKFEITLHEPAIATFGTCYL